MSRTRARSQNAMNGQAKRAFTLMEALVALVMFALIMSALGLALSSAVRSQEISQSGQEENAQIRSLIGVLTRDLSQAFASTHNASSVFIAGGSGSSSGPSGASGSLLTLTTLSHRIEGAEATDPQNSSGTAQTASPSTQPAPPQSDVQIVRYDFNAQSDTLQRSVCSVPNLQTLGQSPPGPQNILSDSVVQISLRFWDATQQTWRTDWDYEQQNQAQSASGQSGQTGQTGQSGQTGTDGQGADTSAATAPTTSGDSSLPGAVEVTLLLKKRDGTPLSYVTTISVLAPDPATDPNNTAPTNTAGGQTGGNPVGAGGTTAGAGGNGAGGGGTP